jgi:hypothetical protein
LSRSGNFFQAVLLSFSKNKHSPEALCSIGITRLQRYYGPIRLPKRPSLVIHSHVRLDEVVLLPPTSPSLGISQVPELHCLHPLFCCTPDRSLSAFDCCFDNETCLHPVGRAGHDQVVCNEAYNQIHFRYGWCIYLRESQHRKLLFDTVTRLHAKQSITW